MADDLDRLAVPDLLRPFAEMHLRADRPLRRIAGMLTLDGFVDKIPPADIARCAMALRRAAPDDRVLWQITEPALSNNVPVWHWRMVNDLPRNAAFQRAIEAAIEPGMTVLEIGTGSGLLAMMAARAGADHVWTVESSPVMAMVARECIAANGYADRITVIEGLSTGIKAGDALPRRADLLIHEILSSTVLDEKVIPAVAHARGRLLVPGAPLLPCTVWAGGVLVSADPAQRYSAGEVSGFDLSPLGLIGPADLHVGDGPPEAALSAPARLVEIDLASVTADARGCATVEVEVTADGVAAGVEQWVGFAFPDGTAFESLNPGSNWGRYFHPFGRPRAVRRGERVTLAVDHGPDWLAIGWAPD